MMFYITAINGVFAFLIAGGVLATRNGVTNEFLLNLILYRCYSGNRHDADKDHVYERGLYDRGGCH